MLKHVIHSIITELSWKYNFLRITIKYSHAVYIFIGALQILTHLTFIKILRQFLMLLWSHFVDEETGAQSGHLASSS